MQKFKYKLNEMSKVASSKDAEKELDKPKEGFKVGQVTISDDGTRKSTITSIDPETGAVRWKIEQLPGYDKLYDELDDLVDTAKKTAQKSKDDLKFRDFYDEIRVIRNKVRTHLRKNHPDIYDRIQMQMAENEVEEISTTGGGAGAASFSAGTGMQYATPYAFRKKGSKPNDEELLKLGYKPVDEGIGATLGPGPKATEDGVKDNALVKQFKYKLVPKNKDGTYVQKGSGLEVKKLF